MSIPTPLVSFPSASLCAAVALACSLAACGGGGGDNTDGNPHAQGAAVSRSSDTSTHHPDPSSTAGQGHEGTDPQDSLSDEDILRAMGYTTLTELLDDAARHRFTGGQVIDPSGQTYTAGQWMQRLQQSCPRPVSQDGRWTSALPAHIGCLAGTYIGLDPETSQTCRVTLAEDGAVTFLYNGADRPLMRLSADNAQYWYGPSLIGGPDVQALSLTAEARQIQPERTATVQFQMLHGVLAGRAVRMLDISHEDSDLTLYRPVVEGETSDSSCMLFHDISKVAG